MTDIDIVERLKDGFPRDEFANQRLLLEAAEVIEQLRNEIRELTEENKLLAHGEYEGEEFNDEW
jgi:hypothetical protein